MPLIGELKGVTVFDTQSHMLYRQHASSWTGDRTKIKVMLKKKIHFYYQGRDRYRMLAEDIVRVYSSSPSTRNLKLYKILIKEKRSLKDKLFLIFSPYFAKKGFFKNLKFKIDIALGKS